MSTGLWTDASAPGRRTRVEAIAVELFITPRVRTGAEPETQPFAVAGREAIDGTEAPPPPAIVLGVGVTEPNRSDVLSVGTETESPVREATWAGLRVCVWPSGAPGAV